MDNNHIVQSFHLALSRGDLDEALIYWAPQTAEQRQQSLDFNHYQAFQLAAIHRFTELARMLLHAATPEQRQAITLLVLERGESFLPIETAEYLITERIIGLDHVDLDADQQALNEMQIDFDEDDFIEHYMVLSEDTSRQIRPADPQLAIQQESENLDDQDELILSFFDKSSEIRDSKAMSKKP